MNLYILCTLFQFSVAAESLRVPHLRGPYSVAYQVQDLTDTSRLDPSAQTGSNSLRRILFSVFLPVDTKQTACSPEVLPYLPPETAGYYSQLAPSMGLPEDMLASFQVEFCNLSSISYCNGSKEQSFPIAIFSPGHTVSRLLYTSLARNLASHGYVVITVDHPYDADIVEFPDGTVIRGNSDTSTENLVLENLKVRTGDISFIIDQLQKDKIMSKTAVYFPHKIDSENIAVFGHSLGGAAAATCMLENTHAVKGGLDFDGEIWGSVVENGLAAPFILVSSAVNNGSSSLENWNPFWEHLRDSKLQLSIANTAHLSFLDIPMLLTVYTLPEKLKPMEEAVFGKIDGRTMEQTVNGILIAYFELLFRGCAAPLCNLREKFAEISIDRASLAGPSF